MINKKRGTLKLLLSPAIFLLILLILSPTVSADGYNPSQPSHQTLYTDTVTSKTDNSPVSIADNEGLFVTGDITTLGKLGIGTSGPTRALDIMRDLNAGNADLRIINIDGANPDKSIGIELKGSGGTGPFPVSNANLGVIYFENVDNGLIETYSDVPLIFGTNNAERMRITNSGNVGIGTTNPAAKLDVAGTIQTSGVDDGRIYSHSTDNAGGLAGYDAMSGSAVGGFHLLSPVTGATSHVTTAGNYDTYLSTRYPGNNLLFAVGNAEKMRIDGNTGKVGIGTTSPGAKLTVKATDGATGGIRLQQSNDYGPSVNIFQTADDGVIDLYSGENPTYLRAHITSYGNTYFNPASGNVGIGTTSPTTHWGHGLDVNGNIAIHMSPNDGGLVFGDNNPVNAKWHIGYWNPTIMAPNGGLVFTESGVADYRLTLKAGGNIGINSANPGSMVTVSGGDVYISAQNNGIILKDAVDGTCRRVILSGGALSTSGAITCPTN